jgi:error-prone DNA polymerase
VNKSGVRCTAEGKDLRIGLGFVRGWGEEIAEQVVAERKKNGSFRSLPEFLRRTPAALKRPAIENLIWVGGFDDFGLTRRELLWQAGLWLGPETDPERTGGRKDHAQVEMELPEPYAGVSFGAMDPEEEMVAEYRMLHFSASLHPLALVRDQLPRGTVSSGEFKDLPQGATVQLAGIVVARQRPQTAKGYVFVLMEDEDGPVNIIVKPNIYKRDRSTIRMEPFVTVRGRLQKDGETTNVIAFEVKGLRFRGEAPSDRAPEKVHRVRTRMQEEELFPALPGTQEWWPDRDRVEKRDQGQDQGGDQGRETSPDGTGREAPARKLERARETRRQEAQEEAVTERRRREGTPRPAERPSPELPDVREWWGRPEEARKSPFAYLTALRQAPPGTKSWG